MPLTWNKRLLPELLARLGPAVEELGLRVEAEAKRELQPGHGVETGTLRRSIHAAAPSYDFAGDDVEPSDASPERGGGGATAERDGDKLLVAVGSGLVYALAVHQGHGSFGGYHYLTNAVEKVRPKAPAILQKHLRAG